MDSADTIRSPTASLCLIVDDVRACRLQLNRWLSALGYHCLEADGAETALEILSQVRPSLIVTDIDMPGMSGLELLQLIRLHPNQEVRGTPVVVISSLEDEAVPATVSRCSANAFLAKPLEKQCFNHVIRAIHPQSRQMTGNEVTNVDSSRFSSRFRTILSRIFQQRSCSLP